MTNTPLVSVRGLTKHFPVREGLFTRKKWKIAVDNVSFDISSGETLALVGESGSGKSTVGLMLLDLLAPTAGEVLFDGRPVVNRRGKEGLAFRRKMQVVFQDPYASLNARLTVRETLTEGLIIHGICKSPQEREERALSLLEEVNLPPGVLDRYPHEFSGGQRQRIAIARALSVGPQFIVLDEPTSALDASVQSHVLNLLRTLQRKHGLTYLFITHNLDVVAYMADNVAVMESGRIVERGSVDDIFDRPEEEYTRQLLAAIPKYSSQRTPFKKRPALSTRPAYDWREPFAETFMAMEDDHPYVRFAKAHYASWQESPVTVSGEERIVGVPRPMRIISSTIYSGVDFNRYLYDVVNTDGTPEHKALSDRILDYFAGRYLTDELIFKEAIRRGANWHYSVGNGSSFQGHMVVDYAKILGVGIPGLRLEVEAAMNSCDGLEKLPFYEAMLIYCDNMLHLVQRYTERVLQMLSEEESDTRREELCHIAAVCDALTQFPPRTFREACQLFWFAFLLDCNDDPGRFDQYMYPFYRRDIDNGTISPEDARSLVEELWYRMDDVVAWSLVLGGLNLEGEDASNDLTFLCLDITSDLRMLHPAVALRVSKKTPDTLWHEAIRCIARGGGMPSLVNDDAVVSALVDAGVEIGEARDYGMGGCIEFQISGKSNFGGEDGQINLAKCLELALNNGHCALTGEKLGPETGDPRTFRIFDDVMTAYKRQVEAATNDIITQCNIGQEIKSKQGAKLFRSLLIDDCISRGIDCEGGGARYGNGQILTNGAIVTADSLTVLKTLVFDEGLISMPEMIDALKANWGGYEGLRRTILKHAPRYGNDDPRADGIAREVVDHFWSLLKQHRTYRGGHFTGLLVYYNRQLYYGNQTAATPDGRYDLDVLEDSVGPWPGRDKQGPTAMLNSAAKMPQILASGGVVLNLRLNPDCFTTDESLNKTIALIQGYFALGGQQVQVTVASAEDLKSAMSNPEDWGHLIVRVGGYSDHFVNLEPKLQESILQRTGY